MGLELATGLFGLGGVIVGALATTGGQVYLERRRERREGSRAKQLVAGELLHAEMIMRAAAVGSWWPRITDINALLPVSAWAEYRVRLVDSVDSRTFDQLVGTYAKLEVDRERFRAAGNRADSTMTASEAAGLMTEANELGRQRGSLGSTAGWPKRAAEPVAEKLDP